jgi:hypothetical protein
VCDVLTVGRPHFLQASTHNSTSARWASKSSTGRNYRRCSGHGKIQDRNNTTRHYTSSLAHNPECRGLIPSNHKLERCYWAADGSRAKSRSHASDRCAAYERARRTQWLAAVTIELHLIRRVCATLVQHTGSAAQMRQVVLSRNTAGCEPSPRTGRTRPVKGETRGVWTIRVVTARYLSTLTERRSLLRARRTAPPQAFGVGRVMARNGFTLLVAQIG